VDKLLARVGLFIYWLSGFSGSRLGLANSLQLHEKAPIAHLHAIAASQLRKLSIVMHGGEGHR
jgi:hypothetical protein